MISSYKTKLLEQLVRVKWCGQQAKYNGIHYCISCNAKWHGRRVSIIAQRTPDSVLTDYVTSTGELLTHFGSAHNFSARDCLIRLRPDDRLLRLRGHHYIACNRCQVRTHILQKKLDPLSEVSIRVHVRKLYDYDQI